MRRLSPPILCVLLLFAVGCGSTAIQREMQYAIGIKAVQDSTIQALDLDILNDLEAGPVQAATRTATALLKKAVASRRAGEPYEVGEALLDGVLAALAEAEKLIQKGGK